MFTSVRSQLWAVPSRLHRRRNLPRALGASFAQLILGRDKSRYPLYLDPPQSEIPQDPQVRRKSEIAIGSSRQIGDARGGRRLGGGRCPQRRFTREGRLGWGCGGEAFYLLGSYVQRHFATPNLEALLGSVFHSHSFLGSYVQRHFRTPRIILGGPTPQEPCPPLPTPNLPPICPQFAPKCNP